MKSTKEKILEEAVRLFMTKGYEGTSIKEIETAIGKTRGAIFYSFKNKQQLFEAVVDEYILNIQTIYWTFDIPENLSLKEFIYLYINGIQKTMAKMLSLCIVNIYKSYYALYLEASRYYPNFSDIAAKNLIKEIQAWENVIKEAIKSKEIQDIDASTYALLFRSCFVGLSFERCLTYGLNPEELLKIYSHIYESIRIK